MGLGIGSSAEGGAGGAATGGDLNINGNHGDYAVTVSGVVQFAIGNGAAGFFGGAVRTAAAPTNSGAGGTGVRGGTGRAGGSGFVWVQEF
jgi:hypothetical protein